MKETKVYAYVIVILLVFLSLSILSGRYEKEKAYDQGYQDGYSDALYEHGIEE